MRTLAAGLMLLVTAAAPAGAADGYRLLKTVPVPGDGGWDYLIVDDAGRRVYLSHGNQVDVLDADTDELKGTIADTKGVHGIAVASDLGRGFTSNGRGDSVTIFDLKTLKTLGDGQDRQGPRLDPLRPVQQARLRLQRPRQDCHGHRRRRGQGSRHHRPGRPARVRRRRRRRPRLRQPRRQEHAASARRQEDERAGPLAARPRRDPDRPGHGHQASPPVRRLPQQDDGRGQRRERQGGGQAADRRARGRAAFDLETGLVYFSCGDGTVSVFHQDEADKYTAAETIKTKTGSKTMALDRKTHKLFLPSADFKPNQATGGAGRRWCRRRSRFWCLGRDRNAPE